MLINFSQFIEKVASKRTALGNSGGGFFVRNYFFKKMQKKIVHRGVSVVLDKVIPFNFFNLLPPKPMKYSFKIVFLFAFLFCAPAAFAQEGLYIRPSVGLQKGVFQTKYLKGKDVNSQFKLSPASHPLYENSNHYLGLFLELQGKKFRWELGMERQALALGYRIMYYNKAGNLIYGGDYKTDKALGISLNYARRLHSVSLPNAHRFDLEGVLGLTYFFDIERDSPHNFYQDTLHQTKPYKLSVNNYSGFPRLLTPRAGLYFGLAGRLYNRKKKPVLDVRFGYRQGLRQLKGKHVTVETSDGQVQEVNVINRGSNFTLSVGIPIRFQKLGCD